MARAAVAAPLTDADYQRINELLKRCALYKRDIQTAQQAGMQLDDHLKLEADLCQELEGYKRAFFPDRP